MIQGKTILITGATSGIGLATARALAGQGAHLILAARSEAKLKEASQDITSTTGQKNISYYTADLSSQKSIRAMAAKVKADHSSLDVLINNAGGVFPDFALTDDGLEMTIATNHFSQFLLTSLLLDLIKNSEYARIVNVSSDSHYNGKIDFESFKKDKGYFIIKAYAQSSSSFVTHLTACISSLLNSNAPSKTPVKTQSNSCSVRPLLSSCAL